MCLSCVLLYLYYVRIRLFIFAWRNLPQSGPCVCLWQFLLHRLSHALHYGSVGFVGPYPEPAQAGEGVLLRTRMIFLRVRDVTGTALFTAPCWLETLLAVRAN